MLPLVVPKESVGKDVAHEVMAPPDEVVVWNRRWRNLVGDGDLPLRSSTTIASAYRSVPLDVLKVRPVWVADGPRGDVTTRVGHPVDV